MGGRADGDRARATMSRVTGRDEESGELWRRRAASFGEEAAAYAEHRPDYAQAAVGGARAGARPRPGPGARSRRRTGKLTAVITRLAGAAPAGQLSVVALEPDPAMLAELRRSQPGVPSLAGQAEHIPLPDASVDAVLCGQAAHWFDMDRAVLEFARVLTPGGVFAGLWNLDDDRVDWVAGLSAGVPAGQHPGHWRPASRTTGPGTAVGAALFGPGEREEFAHGQLRTADSLVATLATHSRQLVMEPAERQRLMDRVRDYLRSRPETAVGEFSLPMVTGVLRSVKI